MITLQIALSFFGIALGLAIAPGPDIIFVLTQSALYGARAGLSTTLGLMSGLFFHTALVAVGVAAVFQHSPTAFLLLKGAGAAYLLYLAWLSLRSGAVLAQGGQGTFIGYAALYRRGVLMNITNPKVTLFFLPFCRSSVPLNAEAWSCRSSSSVCSFCWPQVLSSALRPCSVAVWPCGSTPVPAHRYLCTVWPHWCLPDWPAFCLLTD